MSYSNVSTLVNLTRDPNQDNFYDLFVQNYTIPNSTVTLNPYLVDRTRNMRLDLVCVDLYGDVSNLQLMMKLNNIENPFGIQEGDLLLWVDVKSISTVQTIDPKIVQNASNNLIAAFKASYTDPARAAYLNNRGKDNLPPNILPDSANKIQISNNQIVVGGNLFTNPNNQALNVPTGTSALGNIFAGQDLTSAGDVGNGVTPASPTIPQDEQTTRVLVKTFIKSGNT